MGGCFENGLFLAAASSFLFSLCGLTAKLLPGVHPLQLSAASFLGSLAISGGLALLSPSPLFPPECRKALFSGSLASSLFLVSSFFAVQLMPLGDASILFYTAPIFTAILAKEPSSVKNIIFSLLLLICMILVTKPPFIYGISKISQSYLIGFVSAITASFTDAFSNVTLRDLRTIHYSVVLFNYSLMSFLQISVLTLFFTHWTPLTLTEVGLLLILVVLNSVEQIFMTLALQFERATLVALIQASDIIYGYAFQIIFFKENIDVISIFGAIMILILILFISLESKKSKNKYVILKYLSLDNCII